MSKHYLKYGTSDRRFDTGGKEVNCISFAAIQIANKIGQPIQGNWSS